LADNDGKLTEGEVNQVLNAWDFLSFSNEYNNQFRNTYFTPDTVNRQLQNINMNPVEGTMEGIERALRAPKDSETILRNYSTNFEVQNMFYKRLIRYFADIACFNLTFDCTNITKDEEFNSPAFKKDLKILDDFCSHFNFKEEFQKAMKQMLRQGIYYTILRDEGSKYTLQELPPDFCKITGRHDSGLLFDFNFNWFIGNYGVDINMYPKVFKRMYRETFKNVSTEYEPSGNVDSRNSTFIYWHQCSPKDKFWAFKISPEIATLTPYFAALFPEISIQPTVRKLQEDKYFIEASKLLVGIIGMNKDKKSGAVANQINITPDILGKFLGVARQGLAKQIGLTALPMDDIKPVEFTVSERNMLSEYVDNISAQSVASSEPLISTDRLNVHQSKLASAIDNAFIKSIYPLFEDFVDYFVNANTKKYKFKVKFSDIDIPDDVKERQDKFKNLATMGIVDFQQVSRICDMNPFELNRHLSLSKSMGFDKKLIPLMSLNNQTAESQKVDPTKKTQGRQSKEDTDNEDTLNSQARGTSELKE